MCRTPVTIMCVIGILIIISIIIGQVIDIHPAEKDVLNTIVVRINPLSVENHRFLPIDKPANINALNGWQISHIMLHFVMTFIYPDCWKEIAALGFIWEVTESGIGYLPINLPKHDIKDVSNIGYSGDNWIQGSMIDILFNSAGGLLGYGAAKLLTSFYKK